ncbi:isochorismatase domain-containing protein 1-like [Mercenaria mercenaria]|uniref:isochorismatase domain-containing protein 1-like n=1 Tax=Mercenaria mercenaria TaxID=6596 RepID=UPI00234E7AC5|nr:isochorismatase domain-containing protein 1-like [Mercenaria mercenaria]
MAKLGNIIAGKTVFFCCDMQEKFRPAIQYFSDIVTCASRLLEASKILEIPVIVTEQYSKGLGKTVSELDISHAAGVFDKTKFSMVLPEVEEKMKHLCEGDVTHVVLFGIEAHVCVQQTVIDLLEKRIVVHVIADACSSRSQMDRQFAYERFRAMGATVTTSEAILLQLVGDKNHPKFKEIQGLIKTSAPTSGLVKL